MKENKSPTLSFAKLFLLMGIPFFGQIFTLILSFSKEVDYELKCLARGMLIAQVIFISLLIVVGTIYFYSILPIFSNLLDKLGVLRILML